MARGEVVYLSPAVIDIVTMAEGIFEGHICGAVLTAPTEVLDILGNWKPEINRAAMKLWRIIGEGHKSNPDLVETALKAGMLWDVTYWLEEWHIDISEDRAKVYLHKWKCAKAARLGLQAIADDPTVREIIEKSRYKYNER